MREGIVREGGSGRWKTGKYEFKGEMKMEV